MSDIHKYRAMQGYAFTGLSFCCVVISAVFFYTGVGLEKSAARIELGFMTMTTGSVGLAFLGVALGFGVLAYLVRPLVSKHTLTPDSSETVNYG